MEKPITEQAYEVLFIGKYTPRAIKGCKLRLKGSVIKDACWV